MASRGTQSIRTSGASLAGCGCACVGKYGSTADRNYFGASANVLRCISGGYVGPIRDSCRAKLAATFGNGAHMMGGSSARTPEPLTVRVTLILTGLRERKLVRVVALSGITATVIKVEREDCKVRHQFGWDLPPGVSTKDIEDAQGDGAETHECRECGQECDCIADTCCHPDTAECGVSQNFEERE